MSSIIPAEIIENRIYVFRGQNVMIDHDLAKLYGVETRAFKRAVRRHIDRFPEDFMFELTKNELEILRCQIGTSSWGGQRYLPFVFTEQGIAMLSSVLNSKQAIAINIQIMRTFVHLRDIALNDSNMRRKLESLEKHYNEQFKIIFDTLRRMLFDDSEKPKIGFKKK